MDLAAKIKALLDALTADDPEAIKAAATDLLSTLAGGDSAPAPAPADALAADPEPVPAKLAALAAIRDLTGAQDLVKAVAELKAWKSDRDAEAQRLVTIEEVSRAVLVGDLVKLNAETPATAWTGEGKDRKLVDRLAKEPLAEMRTRVAALRAAHPQALALQPPAATPLPVVDGTVVVLSAHEQATADAIGDPVKKAKFIELRANRARSKG